VSRANRTADTQLIDGWTLLYHTEIWIDPIFAEDRYNFLEAQAKYAKKRRAKAISKMQRPKLFERPDEITDEFTIDCRDGAILNPGEELRCFPGTNGVPVDVARAYRNIGFVGEGGGAVLRRCIEQRGVGRLRILSFNSLTNTAQAQIVKD